MTTLTVTATHDYRSEKLFGINAITFNAPDFVDVYFSSAQFGGAGISNTLHVTGDSEGAFIHVTLPESGAAPFSAAGWTFSHWPATADDVVFISGRSGADTITGSSGRDYLSGGRGADSLAGLSGDDYFAYGQAAEIVSGERVNGGPGTDTLVITRNDTYDFTFATLTSIERLAVDRGGSITLTEFQIGAGAIRDVDGSNGPGSGPVHLTVFGSSTNLSTVAFHFWKSADTIELMGTNVLSNHLVGSSQSDIITAPDGSADVMRGGGGNDFLIGGTGKDTLTGNGGNDRFVFDAPLVYVDFRGHTAANRDLITDFHHNQDSLRLAHAVFTHIATGRLSADAFHLGAHAADRQDRIVYDQPHGKVYYDPDGTGPQSQVLFVVLDGHPVLDERDIVVA